MLAKVLLWLHQSCAEGCNLSFGPRIGGAVGVAVLATFVLLRQQNIWLERRCNDAERGWAVGEWLFKINIGLAFIGLISSKAALLLIALGLPQRGAADGIYHRRGDAVGEHGAGKGDVRLQHQREVADLRGGWCADGDGARDVGGAAMVLRAAVYQQ